ncbi:MAG: Cell wall hydrolase, partial [Hyphomicrobiales bacterium]|nr:Cell wall hydrolase [Hyphomicrobiales bacterium]
MLPALSLPPAAPDVLIPPATASVKAALRLAWGGPSREARLVIGDPDELRAPAPEEFEPRRDLKRNVVRFPEPDRSRKGDPFIGLRPTFDARLRARGLVDYRAAEMLSGSNYLAFEGLQNASPSV